MSEEEDLTCFLCAFPFEANQRVRCVGVCGHNNVCSICFLRLRSIQRNFSCASCKQQLDHVICSDKVGAQFSDFTIWGDNIGPDYIYDEKSQMFFQKPYHISKVETLWAFKCGICKQTRRDMKQLKQHYQAEHNMQMCELCIENKQAFPSEQKVYKQSDYENHLRKGDQDGSEGHPKCEFCRKRYYDKTGLFMHLARDHFTCHLCDRAGIQFKYYADYKNLEDHYRGAHQICEDPVCLAKRYVVFSNGIDLAAHSLAHHPFMQTKRAIPIHFKVRRPQNPEKEADAEDDEDVSGREGGGNHRGNGQYEGGMGGRARGGEWQVEMPPTARDPRDAARALRQAAVEPAAFVTAGRAFEDSLEEYPALAKVGGGALTVGGWGSINNNNNNKKQDFPALGPGPAVRGAGGGGAGRSFSGATTGSYIRDGKVGGVGSQGASDDSWAITNKKMKRLTPSGGVSKPASSTSTSAAAGWGKGQGQAEEAEAASKIDNYPQLSKGPKAYRKESKAALAVPPVRVQPLYTSLSVLSRDDSSMYKVAGSSNSNRSLASLADSDDSLFTSADQLAHQEAAALALAVAQIEEMELVDQSSYVDIQVEVEAEVDVEVEVKQAGQSVITKQPVKEKKEIKKVKKSSAPALDGWGTAIKTVGIGAPVKKAVTGLSLAKPIKKSSTSSVVKVGNTGGAGAGAAVTTSRSFDDLKQIGRYQRDLEEQHQLQLDAGMQLDAKKSHSEKKEASFGVDDFPVLGGTGRSGSAPHPHSFNNSKHSDNNYSSSSSGGVESMGTGSASALSVEQRNENIRAFVQEARMKKALSSPPLDVDLYDSDPYTYDDGSYGGSNYFDGVNSNINSSSSKVHEKEKEKEKSSGTGNGIEKSAVRVGNWTKMGGVSAAPVPVPVQASNDDDEYEFFDYTQSTAPISFSDSDYPSLGPGPPKKDNNVRSNGNGNGKYTAAALASGISRPAKSAADLLLAKKEKTNKRIGNLTQDIGVSKA